MIGNRQNLFIPADLSSTKSVFSKSISSELNLKSNIDRIFKNIYLLNQSGIGICYGMSHNIWALKGQFLSDTKENEISEELEDFYYNEKKRFTKWQVAQFPKRHKTLSTFAKGVQHGLNEDRLLLLLLSKAIEQAPATPSFIDLKRRPNCRKMELMKQLNELDLIRNEFSSLRKNIASIRHEMNSIEKNLETNTGKPVPLLYI